MAALVDDMLPSTAQSTVPYLEFRPTAFAVLANHPYPTPTH